MILWNVIRSPIVEVLAILSWRGGAAINFPNLAPGEYFLVDEYGAYLTDENGAYLIGKDA
jgi:hypothetical protein